MQSKMPGGSQHPVDLFQQLQSFRFKNKRGSNGDGSPPESQSPIPMYKPMNRKVIDSSSDEETEKNMENGHCSEEIKVTRNPKRNRILSDTSDTEEDCFVVKDDYEDECVVIYDDDCVEVKESKTKKDDSTETNLEKKFNPNIEAGIKSLHAEFPHVDIMDVQDIFAQNGFSCYKATRALKMKYPNSAKKATGIKFEANNDIERANHSLKQSPVKVESPKKKKKKTNDVNVEGEGDDDYRQSHGDLVADSSSEDEDELTDDMTKGKTVVFDFLQTASIEELAAMPGCSRKKASHIDSLRPFEGWIDLVTKFRTEKYIAVQLINSAKDVLEMRQVMSGLLRKCELISEKMENRVGSLLEGSQSGELQSQPESLNSNYSLAPYQMIGLNWLALMHQERVNGVLADEMGLGKTVETIAFLTYLYEQGDKGPHLVVVPSSTLDNWLREIQIWSPSLTFLTYYGSQDQRRQLRIGIINNDFDNVNIIFTTYNMVCSSPEDRVMFKRLKFRYAVFDEAHMLKNITSQRYQYITRINADRRLLLTGTPLQNNLLELVSLLIFVMPQMFAGKRDAMITAFNMIPKSKSDGNKAMYEQEKIEQAKRIMKPFFLRRLKSEVLKDLPTKTSKTELCPMTRSQQTHYDDLVERLSDEAKKIREEKLLFNEEDEDDLDLGPSKARPSSGSSGMNMLTQLRKMANHPLLARIHYTDDKCKTLAAMLLKQPGMGHKKYEYVYEDLTYMSDFQIHDLLKKFERLSHHLLPDSAIVESGKMKMLDKWLPEARENGDRVLLFSQFVMVLDIVQEYMNIRGYKFLRLDGSTPVAERQQLIDTFTNDRDIHIFLLSTRAGGLGINLAAANIVIIHDIDFNPYNDRQAEDRCHRVGQQRPVKVIRMVSDKTIEEGMLRVAQQKLKLESDLTADKNCDEEKSRDVKVLLKQALRLKT